MVLADEIAKKIGTATYIPHFGDTAEIHGNEWEIHESTIAQEEEAAMELKAALSNMESDYLKQKSKMEQIITRDADKAAALKKKMDKLRKYMDELLSDL